MTRDSHTAAFRSGDAEIAYLDAGEGEPVVLVHGFASTKEANWVVPGWIDTLTRAGRRAIALDNRGHGASSASAMLSGSPTPATSRMPRPPITMRRARSGWASARYAVMRAPIE